jgi:four helix bundle protein
MKKSIKNLDENLVGDTSTSYDSNRDFTTLEAWKKARKVKLFFYNSVLPLLPKEERYGLRSQIQNASVSCAANIAEGYGRYHYQGGIQFYRISRASMYELKDHLITCYDLEYIGKELFDEGLELIEDAKITLNGYIGYVKKQKAKS